MKKTNTKENNQPFFLALAKKRKTAYEFSDKKVEDKDIKTILEAARWAPSCSNLQPWHFIIVKNKKAISDLMSNFYFGDFHTDPPLIIAFVLRYNICKRVLTCKVGGTDLISEGRLCVGMAALSAVFEATDLGINSAILTPSNQEEVKKILRVKKVDSVPLMIALGYEKKGAFQKKRTRKLLKNITSNEVFVVDVDKQLNNEVKKHG